jgi:hypothetical protein
MILEDEGEIVAYWRVFAALESYCCSVGHACSLFELGELSPCLVSQTGE